MSRKKHEITVGILNYFTLKPLKACINSLYENTHIPFKLHLVNQGYLDDDLVEYYSSLERWSNVQITYLNKNIGPVPGRKFLSEHLDTSYLFFSDNDICFTDGWLTPLIKKMEEDPLVGAISPIFYERGETLRGWGGDLEGRDDELLIGDLPLPDLRKRARRGFAEVDYGADGCVLIRGSVFDEVMLDENYYLSRGAYDFFMQMSERGWHSLVCLNSKVKHKAVFPPPIKRLKYESVRYYQSPLDKDREYFKKKWGFQKVTMKHRRREGLKEKIKHFVHLSLPTLISRLFPPAPAS